MRNSHIQPVFELKILESILRDPLSNHYLDEIVPLENISIRPFEFLHQTPNIRLIEKGSTIIIEDDLLEEDEQKPKFGDLYSYKFDVMVTFAVNQRIVYNNQVYDDIYEIVSLVGQIIRSVFADTREYSADGIKIDDIRLVSKIVEYYVPDDDHVSMLLSFEADVEIERQY